MESPTFRFFFPLPPHVRSFFSPSLSSRGIVAAVQGRGPPKLRVWEVNEFLVWAGRAVGRRAVREKGPRDVTSEGRFLDRTNKKFRERNQTPLTQSGSGLVEA